MKYIHLTTIANPSSNYLGYHLWLNASSNVVSCTFGEQIATLSSITFYADKIRSFIDSYKNDHSSITASTDFILSQYGRIGRYNDITWSIAGGTIDSGLKAALDERFAFFKNVQEIELPNGDTLDAPHFWAVINTIMNGFGDLGGWAGDLVEFAALLKTSPDETFPTTSSAFDKVDWNSDADAYNIMKIYSNDIIADMKGYFTSGLTEKQRINTFITSDDIKTRFDNSPNKTPYLNLLMQKYGVTDITDAANKMQAYLDENK